MVVVARVVSEFARKYYPFKSAERVQNDAMAECYIWKLYIQGRKKAERKTFFFWFRK